MSGFACFRLAGREHLAGWAPGQVVLLLSLVLFLFSVALYSGSLKNDFVWDDVGVFLEDPSIRDYRNIPGFFVSPLVLGEAPEAGVADTARIHYYRPLTSVLHVFEYRWFGSAPLGYKAVNLVLNGLLVVCAFLLVRAVTARTGVAFLAALLYAAIPARGEVVYWAYSDSHILAALFSLLALLAYHYRRRTVALAGMTVALLFQEGAILLPLVLAGYEWLAADARREEGKGWMRLLPFVLLAGSYLVLRQQVAGALPFSPLPPGDMLRGWAYLLVKYAKILFVPDGPVTMYLYTPGMFVAGGVAGPGTLLAAAGLLLVGFVLWRRSKPLLFWYGWFFAWLAPTFNIGGYANYLMAEKGLYLASLGACVLLAMAAVALPRQRPAAVALFLLLVGWQAGQVVSRAPYWANSVTYLEQLLMFEPRYDVAHYQLAVLAMRSGEYPRAIERFEKVSALRPDLQKSLNGLLATAHAEWGRTLAEQRRFAEALAALQASLRYDPQRSTTWNALGVVNFLRGDLALAIGHWQKAVALDPQNAEAAGNLRRYGAPGGAPATP